MVRLRLSTSGKDEKKLMVAVETKIDELIKIIGPNIYGYELFGEEKVSLESIVGKLLREQNKTLSTAESCTGGYVAHLITSVSGSSDYYVGSVISYSNQIKETELHISKALLQSEGAVSKMVVEQMANAIQQKFKTDYSIATSGIAGPTGGTADKPVGTVWIAIATPEKIISEKFLFGNHRERTIQKTADAALNMLRKELE